MRVQKRKKTFLKFVVVEEEENKVPSSVTNKSCQMSIKVAEKDFIRKIKDLVILTTIA